MDARNSALCCPVRRLLRTCPRLCGRTCGRRCRIRFGPRNALFTGRESDLAALAAKRSGRTVLTQHVTGLGGIGKTSLSLEYAHRQLDAGQIDLAWWFRAEDRPALLAFMARAR